MPPESKSTLSNITDRFDILQSQMTVVLERLDDVREGVALMKAALYGDSNSQRGVLTRMAVIEDKVATLSRDGTDAARNAINRLGVLEDRVAALYRITVIVGGALTTSAVGLVIGLLTHVIKIP